MISNYLYTIGKYLSPGTRAEVLKDIEVNLYDYLIPHSRANIFQNLKKQSKKPIR